MDSQAPSVRSDILKKLKPSQNLLAVSKLQPPEKIKHLYSQGQIHFGENYVQEALKKITELSSSAIQWHLIGPLQKNKVKLLKNHFAYIHSVDSIELAQLISEKSLEAQHQQKCFLQVNLSGEESKSGFTEAELFQQWEQLKALKGLCIVGLMTMPPLENEPEKNRSYFRKLKSIGDTLSLSEFSMGTSQDYIVALEEGSTWIRLGTLLFGERETTQKTSNESRIP
ncbi:MAG: YggS family pyridoxal phosphate enzyme [Bdellovibrionales bacterium RIFCSPHIGHO2_01_FULL_40_29]|nr:MAG: YggS family pyridoxal phosphate enzyme [Bdellovibrionales bacterium RIFCSPHIGHO2_01_FULL_40_29]OFZ35396.1 MAG: YggS family pyridoxal phosphate enzyme [Bdellovibrionales bacterium RIFCSPHIGHO2_02_FULL_40_15]